MSFKIWVAIIKIIVGDGMTKKNLKKVTPFCKYLAGTMDIITVIVLVLFKIIDILPGEYFGVLCVLLLGLTLVFSLLLLTHRRTNWN